MGPLPILNTNLIRTKGSSPTFLVYSDTWQVRVWSYPLSSPFAPCYYCHLPPLIFVTVLYYVYWNPSRAFPRTMHQTITLSAASTVQGTNGGTNEARNLCSTIIPW